MQKLHTPKIKYVIPLVLLGLYFPTSAFALLSSVPVNDEATAGATNAIFGSTEKFRMDFRNYVDAFKKITVDDQNTSLRQLISVNPGTGMSAELFLDSEDKDSVYKIGGKARAERGDSLIVKCKRRDITNPTEAKPSDKGAWQNLIDEGYIDKTLPDFSAVKVNNSTSLACLMQEMVEYNKLQVNLQIHSLLRDYINTALAASLSQRTSGMIAKANLDWAKRGNVVTRYDSSGIPISNEETGMDPDAYKQAMLESSDKSIQDRILGNDPTKPSYGLCSPIKFTTARYLRRQAEGNKASDIDAIGDATKCSLVSGGLLADEKDYNKFIKNPSLGLANPFDSYDNLLSNTNNTSQGAKMFLDVRSRIRKGKISSKIDSEAQANGGIVSARQCDPDDPNCDFSTSKIVTPGSIVMDITKKAVNQQTDAVSAADTPEKQAALPKNNFSSVSVMNQGLADYDTQNLYPNQSIEKYMGEFLNGIRGGYYDLQSGTIDWASGAMLQIYDKTMTNSNAFRNMPSSQSVEEETEE